MKMSQSEKYAQQLFLSRYKVSLHKIDELGGELGKTSDFEFIQDGKRIFVCELKEFKHREPSAKDGWKVTSHPNGSIESTGPDNATNRISKDISEAYLQLSGYSEPKVLAFLNHSYRLDYKDLEETYKGYQIFGNDAIRIKNIYARRASEGKIKDIKSKIDLYIWIDTTDSRIYLQEDRVTFLFGSECGRNIARDYFGIS